jgi:glycerol-3-phosphate acyltransferase PlsY
MLCYFIAAVVGYLLGSIPFGYILVRAFTKQDIRSIGSGNIGATNVARMGSKGLSATTFVLDTLKGSLAVFAGLYINALFNGISGDVTSIAPVVAGIAALLGHVYPVWLRFRGGKGVATGLGIFLVPVPRAAMFALLIFVLIFLLTRIVSLASIAACASMPFLAFWLANIHPVPAAAIVEFVVVPLIIIAKHHENIRRLLNGTEHSFRKSAAA